jgi:hypothetical protein
MHLSILSVATLFAATLHAQCCTGSLATLTNGNVSFGVGGGNFFDANVTNPLGLFVCAIDTKTTAASGVAITVDIYTTPGTYLGVQQNPAAWRRVATGTGTGIGSGSSQPPVPVTLAQPFYLPAGSHGVFVQIVTGGGPQYTSGANTFGNADLTLTLGASQSSRFSSAPATPRTWNGVIYYSTCATGGEAGYGTFGLGCAGTMPATTLQHTSRPVLGQSLAVGLDNLPQSVAIMMAGISITASPFGPLPLDLAILGAPGCTGRVSPDAVVLLVGANNAATFTLGIPNRPALQCLQFYNQALVLDPGSNALGAVVSDAAAGIIGL